ncbi:DNA-3-methyladenine glycosylase [Bacillus sp. M6-12]|uniref:DNA-3-methyladenine glycosylase family protein n=1 Tax=Bacillus sp. M6-12 TaxID=2054166 RepID=UPI000C793FC7|nr:DNA-3-methyladenine glycosylase [Bacillus sp. M6-12]PLS14740.1 DNA-3-methyladenine glycosylase [Bacillus sp. M6-12]
MWTETLKVQGPYNFDLVLDRLMNDPLNVIDKEQRSVKVPLRIEGRPIVIEVRAIGSTDDPAFSISSNSEGDKEAAINRLKKIFHWHQPLSDISSHFMDTDLMGIFEEHRGTAIVLDFDYYGCLVKCIIHQQLNLKFAYTLTARFVQTFGIQRDGVWFYPTPETTAEITIAELREIQFSGRKAEYVTGLAKAIVQGELNLEQLIERSDAEILESLTKQRGIGKWTAENFLLFGLGRPNLFPMADIGLQNALKQLYNLPQKPTIIEMEAYTKNWSPFLSYASLYLWRSIEKRSENK